MPLNSSALSIFLAVRYASMIGIERSKEIEAKEGNKFSSTRQTRSVVFLCVRTRPFCACRKNPDENKLETSRSLMITHNIAEGVETVKFFQFQAANFKPSNLEYSNFQIFKFSNFQLCSVLTSSAFLNGNFQISNSPLTYRGF